MEEHREHVNGQQIAAYIEDLEARWRFEDERRRVYITRDGAEFEHVMELPAPVQTAWEFVTSPDKRPLWQGGVDRVDEETTGGRRGTGTVAHCVHGGGVAVQEILGWRPFRYFTMRSGFPAIGRWTWTFEFEPLDDDHTELRVRGRKLRGLKRRAAWTLTRPFVMKQGRGNERRLQALLDEHTSRSGSTVSATPDG